MDIKEAATILQFTKEEVKKAIEEGIELPKSKRRVYLKSDLINDRHDIDEENLEAFLEAFEEEEPGRHPPVPVRRELLIEARHRCAICNQIGPIEFHHIIEFSKLKHYDTKHMIALCPTDHTRCGNGEIDQKAQYEYKKKLKYSPIFPSPHYTSYSAGEELIRFSWDDLKEVILAFHDVVNSSHHSGKSKYDFSDVELKRKNKLNKLGENYYLVMSEYHEPYFARISDFLENPVNSSIHDIYFEIIDELRTKIAIYSDEFDKFEEILSWFADMAVENTNNSTKIKRSVLNVLLSFMYFSCDIGKK